MEGKGGQNGPVALMVLLRRKEGMTRGRFLDYWKRVHGPLVESVLFGGGHCPSGPIRYEQWHTTATGGSSVTKRGMDTSAAAEYDGVSVLWFPRLEAFSEWAGEPEPRLLEDQHHFVDLSRSAALVCEARHRWGRALDSLSIQGEHMAFPLVRNSRLFPSDDAFYSRWKDTHGPIVDGVAPDFGGIRCR